MHTHKPSSPALNYNPTHLLLIFVIALALRAGLALWRLEFVLALDDPGDLLRIGSSDVPGWLGYADHLHRVGTLDYWMMGIRPPLFPLSIAGVYALGGGDLAAYWLQVLFGVLMPVAGYVLACRLLGDLEHSARWALVAGLAMACDPASVSAGAVLLSEPLFNLMMTLFLLSLTAFVQGQKPRQIALAGLWMALTMLTRPTAIYLWIVAPLMLAPLIRGWWRPALLLAVIGLAVNLGWGWRNAVDRGVFTYSMQTNFTLLFLRALSAEHLATGQPTDDIQIAYTREVLHRVGSPAAEGAITPEDFWQFHVASTPEIYQAMGGLARERLIRYWPYALAGTFVGLWRMYAVTLGLPGWFTPLELAWHALLYGLAGFGVWTAWQRRAWAVLLLSGLPVLYITGLTLASQTSAMDTRMRSPISAAVIILAVYGAAQLEPLWRSRRGALEEQT